MKSGKAANKNQFGFREHFQWLTLKERWASLCTLVLVSVRTTSPHFPMRFHIHLFLKIMTINGQKVEKGNFRVFLGRTAFNKMVTSTVPLWSKKQNNRFSL